MMATGYCLAPGETLIQCPYHAAHIVTTARLITHLDKCRNNYVKEMKAKGKPLEMVACRFNYTHKIPLPEKKCHEDRCSDGNSVIPALLPQAFVKPITEVNRCTAPEPNADGDDEGEDWDQDCDDTNNKPGYDPSEKIEKDCLLYMPRGMTKSERKAYRVDNRKKWSEEAASTSNAARQDPRPSPAAARQDPRPTPAAAIEDPRPPPAARNNAHNSRMPTAAPPRPSESYDWEEE